MTSDEDDFGWPEFILAILYLIMTIVLVLLFKKE